MAMPTTYSFKHPVLGLLTGVVSPETPEVVTFRAIPYATLPGRFQHSVLRENLNGVSHDFTKVGYACPHSFSLDDVYSGGIHPNQEPIECSEFESLILELNVPKAHLEDVKLQETKDTKYLPVMTYIHGGAFVLGKIDAQHNTAFMVQHSVTEKQPVIIAAIQYRLGALGFLATPDGGKNFALYDQRNALLWIQRFIEGFRGDKSQHTVFGESAGGFSICYHMLSHVPSSGPLFSRGIIMSGIVGPMTTPCSQRDADAVFESLCLKLEVKEKGSAALDKLRSLDVQKLVDASEAWDDEGNSWLPVDDPSFFREKVTWERIPELLGSCEWVNDIVVGNTGFEGQVYSSVAKSMTPQTFQDHLSKSLSNAATAKVMKAYDVSLNMDQNLFLTSAMRWCGDVIFDAPIHAFSQYLTNREDKRLYRYIFDVRNPFPNAPLYQQAHHWVDVYFLFRAMQFRFHSQYLKDLSDEHAKLWFSFAHGSTQMPEYSQAEQGSMIMVADERDGWVCRTTGEYEKTGIGRAGFSRLEEMWNAWKEKEGESWLPLDLRAIN